MSMFHWRSKVATYSSFGVTENHHHHNNNTYFARKVFNMWSNASPPPHKHTQKNHKIKWHINHDDWRTHILDFMASQGSQIGNTLKWSGLKKSHDRLTRIGVTHLTSTKQCDIRSFFVSPERSLPDLNDTTWCALVVIHKFKLDFTFKHIEILYLLYCFLHCNFILIFYISFDNISLFAKCDITKTVTPCLYHTFSMKRMVRHYHR